MNTGGHIYSLSNGYGLVGPGETAVCRLYGDAVRLSRRYCHTGDVTGGASALGYPAAFGHRDYGVGS